MAQWVTKLRGLISLGAQAAPTTRTVAKERLSIILKHQRGLEALSKVDMQQLQAEVVQCVKVKWVRGTQCRRGCERRC